jgi:hypothetical protein
MKLTGGGLSVLSEADLDDSYSKIEIISIARKKLDDAIFERPANLPVAKMPKIKVSS